MERDDNALQQMDLEQQEQEAIQTLMEISSKGMTKQADKLAALLGLTQLWKAPVKVIERRVWP